MRSCDDIHSGARFLDSKMHIVFFYFNISDIKIYLKVNVFMSWNGVSFLYWLITHQNKSAFLQTMASWNQGNSFTDSLHLTVCKVCGSACQPTNIACEVGFSTSALLSFRLG